MYPVSNSMPKAWTSLSVTITSVETGSCYLYWLWVSPMLRTYSPIIALIAMVACAAPATNTTLTLACEGTESSQWGSGPKSSEKINIGIIVDLQTKTVTGSNVTRGLP